MAGTRSIRNPWYLGAALLLVLLTAIIGTSVHRRHVADALLRTDPAAILQDPELLRQATAIGRPQYERHCGACHGAQLQGNPTRGTPNLARGAWLYGDDPIEVERTILYGIRSGHPKARNVTDMPAMVRTGQITMNDAHDVAAYLRSLAGQPHDGAAAERGRSIYQGKGNCYDCHAGDARGVAAYGAPALTGPVYLYGGDPDTLYQSIANGRHGRCPAWIDRLSPLQVRALAITLMTAPRERS